MKNSKTKQKKKEQQQHTGITVHAFSDLDPLVVKIPANLKLEEVFKKLGGEYTILLKEMHLEKAILLCSILTKSNKVRGSEKKRTRYTPLHVRRLEAILTKEKKRMILTALTQGGVIERSPVNYRTGVRSYQYRLCFEYRSGPVKEVEIKNEKLIQKHRSWNESWERKELVEHKGRNQILKSASEMRFDYVVLEEVISCFSAEKQIEYRCDVREFEENRNWKRLNPSRRLLHRGSSFPRILREALYWGDEMKPLHEIDVSSSQPTLAATFYKPDSFEKARYKHIIEKEGFYDFFANRLVAIEEFADVTRQDIKDDSFVPLFFGSNFSDLEPLEKAIQDLFRKEFPDLSQRLRNLKWRNYKHLAHHLKMIEAKVMIDTVATQFASQFPDACLISIHDAFHTTEEHLDVLKVMIETAFEAECGIVPKVKTKMISRERMSESLAAA
ncbi:MAG: hypothetical protein CMO55_15095 [Verrucomicrobiales bacterium]|nr:hypothetical protein [Verrucomicrobiales bacterium]